MKKILFYYSQLNIGGAEKSLIRLMNALARDGHEVTFLSRFSNGLCETQLDGKIKKIYLSDLSIPQNSFMLYRYTIAFIALLQRLFKLLKLYFSEEQYDVALVGLQGLSPWCICRVIKAQKRGVFIRTDLQQCNVKERIKKNLLSYDKDLDFYICVAKSVKRAFDEELPQCATKSIVIYNLLGIEDIHKKLAEACSPFDSSNFVFKILSVCRISDKSKGVFRMLEVCKCLREEGFCFKWYLLGDGPDFTRLHEAVKKNGLEDTFILMGRINNPFPYYRNADLTAVLSYYEGLCGIVNEAKISGAAVIATEFSGIYEQLIPGENGLVVKNNFNSILEGMRKLLQTPELLEKLRNDHYPIEIVDDRRKLEQFYSLLRKK